MAKRSVTTPTAAQEAQHKSPSVDEAIEEQRGEILRAVSLVETVAAVFESGDGQQFHLRETLVLASYLLGESCVRLNEIANAARCNHG